MQLGTSGDSHISLSRADAIFKTRRQIEASDCPGRQRFGTTGDLTWPEVDDLLMTPVYHYRAVMHWMHGTLSSAIEDYNKVIAYHNRVSDPFAEMDASSDSALLYARMGRLTEAEAIWPRCIIIAERLNAGYIVTQNVGTLINVYIARGPLDEALANVERHLALATEMG